MRTKNQTYESILEEITSIPVIDCHEHMQGPPKPAEGKVMPRSEPIASLVQSYVASDLLSAAYGEDEEAVGQLQNPEVSTDEKWPLFSRLWENVKHTAYGHVTRRNIRRRYGVWDIDRELLERIAVEPATRTEEEYFRELTDAGIEVVLTDVLGWSEGGMKAFARGETEFPSMFKPLISLPGFHPTVFTRGTIDSIAEVFGRTVTTLDRFLGAVFEILEKSVAAGAIGIKDQAAYSRSLDYDLVTTADAERQFNRVAGDPRASIGWPDGKPLNDFLFHRYMEFAAELDVPVQLHTGHMAGIRSRVSEVNAAHLRTVLETHRNVRFDLFHGNWPYLGDLLFLGKNYPNTALDLCWLHIIDPDYSVELLERGVKVVPHTKFHAFGGDYPDVPEYAVSHLEIARENTAAALAGLVDSGWLPREEAVQLARGWFYENPKRFFRL